MLLVGDGATFGAHISFPLRLHYSNPAGQLVEKLSGQYLLIQYTPGPRRLADLQTLLGHAKQQLAVRGWNKVIGDHRTMTPFTPEEADWVTNCWLSMPDARTFHGAVLLHVEVVERRLANPPTGTATTLTYRLFTSEATAAAWLAQFSNLITVHSLRKAKAKKRRGRMGSVKKK